MPAAGSAVAGQTTRERLLGAALELLAEGGNNAASVVAITERAGFAAGTLYRHFASKEELLVELFREICSREIEAMQAAASAHDDPSEQLLAALETFARRALANRRLAWALLAEPVDPLVDAERLAYRRRYRDLVAGLLEAAAAERGIEPGRSDLLAAAIVGGVGEVLVGPLSAAGGGAGAGGEDPVELIRTFAARAAGMPR